MELKEITCKIIYYYILVDNSIETDQIDEFSTENNFETIKYKDEHILITDQKIVIKRYYFPLNKSKTIKISQIKTIELIKLGFTNGRYKFYGLNWRFWYFHLDKNRPNKSKAILLNIGSIIKPLITPENIELVFNIINNLIKIKFT